MTTTEGPQKQPPIVEPLPAKDAETQVRLGEGDIIFPENVQFQRFHQFLGNGGAQPAAAKAAGDGRISLGKAVEDASLRGFRNADSGVDDFKAQALRLAQPAILTRKVDQGTEFLIVTVWQSMEAFKHFAGETADAAVVPPGVQAMMVEYDRNVRPYEMREHCTPK